MRRTPTDTAGRKASLRSSCPSLFRDPARGYSYGRAYHHRPRVRGSERHCVAAAFVTILVKEALFRYSHRVGVKLESPALLASAKDHRKDAITPSARSSASPARSSSHFMDPLAAGITSFFIFHIGYETFSGAAHDLMDGCVSEDFVGAVTNLAEGVPGVDHVHEIRCRRSGQYIIVDLKLDMDPEMTVRKSHAIATEVKRLIFIRFSNIGDVMIHVNPTRKLTRTLSGCDRFHVEK